MEGSLAAFLWIALGSGLGGLARFICAGAVTARFGAVFPWGTLLVNVVGSFVIGLFAAFARRGGWLGNETVDAFVMIGVCGGYTTFSSVSLQTLELIDARAWWHAAANIVVSVVLCLVAVGLGLSAGGAP